MHKKIKYYKLKINNKDYQILYSVDEVERMIFENFMWRRLEKVYVNLEGYLYSSKYDDNLIDLSYMGGDTILVFDNACLGLMFHADGILKYKITDKPSEIIECCEEIHECTVYKDDCYCDISQQFTLAFENQTLMKSYVFGTNCSPFYTSDFNMKKAQFYADMNKLPSRICFKLKNGNVFYIQGDEIEYYCIGIEENL